MDKARKKELLKGYKAKEKQNFQDSLPMDEELFWNLFDYVDEKLEANDGCDHSLTFTREFLENKRQMLKAYQTGLSTKVAVVIARFSTMQRNVLKSTVNSIFYR